ncbi:hypothetical protein EJ08DRAFT_698053 [Tothia fuscella]|uniref:Uncharacterized protein n=1 Tax=Tothia fuscella TaxID=1048955 RepID=A0A9P4TYD9_9PEZI|nr:hypothetical protein EJ08DRAFT_698053 [Tothia fuscella]
MDPPEEGSRPRNVSPMAEIKIEGQSPPRKRTRRIIQVASRNDPYEQASNLFGGRTAEEIIPIAKTSKTKNINRWEAAKQSIEQVRGSDLRPETLPENSMIGVFRVAGVIKYAVVSSARFWGAGTKENPFQASEVLDLNDFIRAKNEKKARGEIIKVPVEKTEEQNKAEKVRKEKEKERQAEMLQEQEREQEAKKKEKEQEQQTLLAARSAEFNLPMDGPLCHITTLPAQIGRNWRVVSQNIRTEGELKWWVIQVADDVHPTRAMVLFTLGHLNTDICENPEVIGSAACHFLNRFPCRNSELESVNFIDPPTNMQEHNWIRRHVERMALMHAENARYYNLLDPRHRAPGRDFYGVSSMLLLDGPNDITALRLHVNVFSLTWNVEDEHWISLSPKRVGSEPQQEPMFDSQPYQGTRFSQDTAFHCAVKILELVSSEMTDFFGTGEQILDMAKTKLNQWLPDQKKKIPMSYRMQYANMESDRQWQLIRNARQARRQIRPATNTGKKQKQRMPMGQQQASTPGSTSSGPLLAIHVPPRLTSSLQGTNASATAGGVVLQQHAPSQEKDMAPVAETGDEVYWKKFLPQLMSKLMPLKGKGIFTFYLAADYLTVKPSVAVKNSVKGKLPTAQFYTHFRMLIAFAVGQAYEAFDLGNGILQTWQTLCYNADAVNTGLASKEVALDSHYDGRMICQSHDQSHEDGELSPNELPRLSLTITRSVSNCLRNDALAQNMKRNQLDPVFKNSIKAKALSFIVDLGTQSWKCGYTNTIRNLTQDIPDRLEYGIRHPMNPSVDAVCPIFYDFVEQEESDSERDPTVVEEPKPYYHHEKNLTVTQLALNYPHGSHPPAMIPVFQMGADIHRNGERGDINWANFGKAMDHCFRIRGQIPWKAKTRLALKTLPQKRLIMTQLKSGIWDQDAKIKQKTGHDRTRAGLGTLLELAVKKWGLWDDDYIQMLNKLVDEISNDPNLNPGHGLELARGMDGVPWLWREEHQFVDHCWFWLFLEFAARLQTMDEHCDKEHDTQETPATLLVCYVVQWFETKGGRDPFLGCKMVPFAGHGQGHSIGRSSHVLPGSWMKTGCTNDRPTSYRDHYDKSRRTITIETWSTNRLKLNFAPNLRMLNILFDMLLSIAPETEYYHRPSASLPNVSFPLTWRSTVNMKLVRRLGLKIPESGLSAPIEEAEEEVGDQDDPDDGTLEESLDESDRAAADFEGDELLGGEDEIGIDLGQEEEDDNDREMQLEADQEEINQLQEQVREEARKEVEEITRGDELETAPEEPQGGMQMEQEVDMHEEVEVAVEDEPMLSELESERVFLGQMVEFLPAEHRSTYKAVISRWFTQLHFGNLEQ